MKVRAREKRAILMALEDIFARVSNLKVRVARLTGVEQTTRFTGGSGSCTVNYGIFTYSYSEINLYRVSFIIFCRCEKIKLIDSVVSNGKSMLAMSK